MVVAVARDPDDGRFDLRNQLRNFRVRPRDCLLAALARGRVAVSSEVVVLKVDAVAVFVGDAHHFGFHELVLLHGRYRCGSGVERAWRRVASARLQVAFPRCRDVHLVFAAVHVFPHAVGLVELVEDDALLVGHVRCLPELHLDAEDVIGRIVRIREYNPVVSVDNARRYAPLNIVDAHGLFGRFRRGACCGRFGRVARIVRLVRRAAGKADGKHQREHDGGKVLHDVLPFFPQCAMSAQRRVGPACRPRRRFGLPLFRYGF